MSKFLPRRLFSVVRLGLVLCLCAGAIALLVQINNPQTNFAMPASDPASVVGQPTLPAATVDSLFASVGSPMVGTGKVVEQAARQANIDDAFALGVWWVETNDGAAGVGSADRNPGSVKASGGYPVAFDGYTIYPSYSAAILDWFNVLKGRYISRGLTTVYAISYPYVGTSSSPLWAGKVITYMQRYRAEAPPPTPTPLPRPIRLTSGQLHQSLKGKLADQTQEAAHPAVPPVVPSRSPSPSAVPPTLAPATRDAILVLGLLIALALALYALALDGKLPGFARSRPAAVTTESLHLPATFAGSSRISMLAQESVGAQLIAPTLISPGYGANNNAQESVGAQLIAPAGAEPDDAPPAPAGAINCAPTPALVAQEMAATGSVRPVARVTLRPISIAEPHTTGLLSRTSSLSAPNIDAEPDAEPVSSSGMGLLSRYRRMQQREDFSL